VTYRVEFEGDALERLNGLPKNAFDALVESIGDYGILSFRVDERAELIRIFGILWAG
jgi:hypothetical protein